MDKSSTGSKSKGADDMIEMQFTIPTYGEPEKDIENSSDTTRLN